MRVQDQPANQIEASIAEVLLSQNHYQRLGFSNMSVTPEQIEVAYRDRVELLAGSVTTPADRKHAGELIEASHQCLANAKLRRRYDRTLIGQGGTNKRKEGESLFLGRYKIGEALSKGERAVIYSARDTRLNRDVVVKRIASELLRDDMHRSSMRAEAELFGSFNSSHLVKILDYDVDSGATVMERMATSLQSLATPNGLSSERVQSMIEQALHGLNALHNSGIIHGRIDPSHLLLDDFDCAKLSLTPGLSGVTAALQPGACARHLAPEMLNAGVFGQPSVAVDLYALGFVALELLAGKHFAKRVNQGIAFKGGDLQSWLLWHSSSTDYLPSITDLVPGIHPGFASVLERMTNKDQRERFSTAAECLTALTALQTASPVQETMVSLGDEAQEINLLGTPPQLETIYSSQAKVTWSEILKKPSLLLQPAARNHALLIGVAVMAAVTFSILSTSSSPTEAVTAAHSDSEATNELVDFDDTGMLDDIESPEALSDEVAPVNRPDVEQLSNLEKTLDGWSVKFSIEGGGRVETIDGNRSNKDEPWQLPSGEHRVKFRSSKSNAEYEVAIIIPQGSGSMLCSLIVPIVELPNESENSTNAPRDSGAETIKRSFNVVDFEFPIVGAANLPQAELQTSYLKNIFITIASEPQKAKRLVQSLALPNHPVDPRFAFAHAIVAKRCGDFDATRKYCQRAIADARHFGVVFMPAVLLLTRVHVESNNCATALAECRSTLTELKRKSNIRESQLAPAIDELAWWTGVLVGYMESIHSLSSLENPDVSHTCNFFENACNAEQWTNFRIGRTHVIQQAAELCETMDEFKADYSAAREENRLIRLERYEEQQRKKDKTRFATQRVSNRSYAYSDYPEYDEIRKVKATADQKVSSTAQVPHELPKFMGPTPQAFRTYIPNDSTVLAERTLSSIAVPSESYFVSNN